ncbi:alpha/beta-hydrolase [Fragilariopsis cylindrus CCMP1102]|uniref:Alpha/beta-hydrolase n=1 Tax=Fragilariopsis cylindrus CCMP1102 TaxID=635003 RepID=A0A1E7ESL5_9STRA|nr:alpha/beta-hydrolase [Fragilariopsis cylindrus CCMP1102]|eukprot:OEU08845.1 alpha/beta-hydrolase [Fragilariopsis cylindrus CCMP1102]
MSSTGDYKEPSEILKRLFLPPKTPSLAISSDSQWLLHTGEPPLPSIELLSKPEEKLAGLRFDPLFLAPSRLDYCFDLKAQHLSLLDGDEGAVMEDIPLPHDSEGIRYIRFNPNPPEYALQQFGGNDDDNVSSEKSHKWVVHSVPALNEKRPNFVNGCSYQFTSDGKSLLCKVVPEDCPSEPPSEPVIPSPQIQTVQSNARKAPTRTYQDLLKNQHDEDKFTYFVSTELLKIDLTTNPTSCGIIPYRIESSPCGRYLLVEKATDFSYSVPFHRFGKEVWVWDLYNNDSILIVSNPVDDEIPLSFDACSRHKRRFQFHPCFPHTLLYAFALDGGDPSNDPFLDEDKHLSLREPVVLSRCEWRYDDIEFTESGTTILIDEYRWSDRMERKWKLSSNGETSTKTILWERSWEDRYNSPGSPVRRLGKNGKYFLREKKPGQIFLKGAGASSLGDRPFLDTLNLDTGTKERLWRVKPDERDDVYETIAVIMDDNDSILISRESKTTPRNYYMTSLSNPTSKEIAITAFPHPQPDLIGVKKELVQYKRKDGIELTANLYLPPDYDGTPRPTLFWAYPREFKNSKAAGQIKGSKHRFVSASWASPVHWATKGWCIMDDFSLPVIGEGDAHPNDTFIDQIVAGATAAVEYAGTRGVCDPTKCAVGGHSYGSFMTAHLLSHTSLFAAGIGRSGAFNRTLTPMSFQSEDRSIWEAKDTYITMSPLMHVKKYSEQERVGKMLLIHGQVDENSGTHTLQSERYFAALKAFGIESRLCVLPHERHSYRAKESILHMAWEQEEWLKSLE